MIYQHSHLKPQILPPHHKQFKEQAHQYPLPLLVAVSNNSPPVVNQEDSPADRQVKNKANSPVVVDHKTLKVGKGVHSKAEADQDQETRKVGKGVHSKAEADQDQENRKVGKGVHSKAASSVDRVNALKN